MSPTTPTKTAETRKRAPEGSEVSEKSAEEPPAKRARVATPKTPVEMAQSTLTVQSTEMETPAKKVAEFLQTLENASHGNLPMEPGFMSSDSVPESKEWDSILECVTDETVRESMRQCVHLRADFNTTRKWCLVVPGGKNPFFEEFEWKKHGVTVVPRIFPKPVGDLEAKDICQFTLERDGRYLMSVRPPVSVYNLLDNGTIRLLDADLDRESILFSPHQDLMEWNGFKEY